jgi:hypothetical protein
VDWRPGRLGSDRWHQRKLDLLLGWALGSVIEGLASVIVIWRFTGSRMLSGTALGRARKALAVSLFLLAPFLAMEGIRHLVTGHTSESSGLGVAITAARLLLMPFLGLTCPLSVPTYASR